MRKSQLQSEGEKRVKKKKSNTKNVTGLGGKAALLQGPSIVELLSTESHS